MKLILLLLAFISLTASANPLTDCEWRMSDRVHALIHILDFAETNGVLTRRALERMLTQERWTNPIARASEHVLRSQLEDAFENRARGISDAEIALFRLALVQHLAGKDVTEALNRRASEVTHDVFAPKVLWSTPFLEEFRKSPDTPEVAGTFEGRPVLVLFQTKGFNNYNEVYTVLIDLYNPDEQKRRVVERTPTDFIIGLRDGNLSIENADGVDYLVRWDSKRALDLRSLKKVAYSSLDFGPGQAVKQTGGVKYPQPEETWAGEIPRPLIFRANDKIVATVPHGRQGLALIDIETGTPLRIIRETSKVNHSDFLKPGLVSVGGIPWVYMREPKPGRGNHDESEILLMINAAKKEAPRRIDVGEFTSNIATIKYRGKDHLLWFGQQKGVPHLLDPASDQVLATEALGIQAFTIYPFEYDGGIRAFTVGHFGVSLVAISQSRPK